MRRTFTAEEKASVFELWKNGTGFSEIANILGSKPGTIFTMLRDTGGIKPHERKRAVAHLTLSEREGYTKNAIPIGRSGRLSEVADFVCYLLSERASYITGVTTNIAGGKTRG